MSTPSPAIARYVSGGAAPAVRATSFFAAFLATADRLGADVALCDPARHVELTWSQLHSRAAAIAGGLARLGVKKGDSVALQLSNRHEFFLCDLAAAALGAVPFSIYVTNPPHEIAHLLNDAGPRVVITETALLDKVRQALPSAPTVATVVVVDERDGGEMSLAAVEADGAGFDAAAAAAALGPDDVLTLIYTSGTTGAPKGVELTNANLMGLIGGVEASLPLPAAGGDVISWLPSAHIAERAAHYYLPFARGLRVTICADPAKVMETLVAVRPSWFFAVPRIWEKLKAGIEAGFETLPDPQCEGARRALDVALTKVRLERAGQPVPDALAESVRQADAQLFAAVRASIGLDRAIAVNVGAAPTPIGVLEFCTAIGLSIGEMWGLSETCGVVTSCVPGKTRLGTVGLPLPGYEVRLADDGEVLVRGPGVTRGYRNRPDATAAAIDADGWLASGDIGELDEFGYLRIVDRKKELIVNSSGKNMSPAQIESKVKAASPLIGHAVVIGDCRPYNVALIVLDSEQSRAWAATHGIAAGCPEELAADERIVAAVGKAVHAANEKLSRPEQIKKFTILPDQWVPGGDELTPTMKIKRKPIAAKYAAAVDALYLTPPASRST